MKLALQLAEQGVGYVEPNPPVGCVLLSKDNALIGYGHHQQYGKAHAEVNAIDSVSDKKLLEQAQMIVTLEPCGHFGKTPPCKQILHQYNFSRLIYAVSDPNPLFDDQGLKDIEARGTVVEQNTFGLETDIKNVLDKYLFLAKSKKSYITLKMATTLDGYLAAKSGESKWLSNEKSRFYTHRLRNGHDAVLVGKNTFLIDNPSLNVRYLESELIRENKVILIDTQLETIPLLEQSNLLKSHSSENIFIVTNKKTADYKTVNYEMNKHGQIDLNVLRQNLFELGIKSVLVEGGAHTLSQFLQQQAFNCIKNFITPYLLGDQLGLSWTSDLSISEFKDKISLKKSHLIKFDDDILYSAFLE